MLKVKTFLIKLITPVYDHTQNPKFQKQVADLEQTDDLLNAFLSAHKALDIKVTPVVSRQGEGSAYDEIYMQYTILYDDGHAIPDWKETQAAMDDILALVERGEQAVNEAERIVAAGIR